MNTKIFITVRSVLIICFSICYASIYAQQPTPSAVDKVKGSSGEIISIKGTGFGIDDSEVSVFFGASEGAIQSISDQLLEVRVPPGSTYENISVTNTTSKLTGYTRQHFTLSFGGDPGFAIANLVGQSDFESGGAASGLYDLCMCDFNGDGRVDIATANKDINSIAILTNTSTGPGNVNFTTATIGATAKTNHNKCADLNGDGKPDLVVTEFKTNITSGDRIFIFQNSSAGTISFLAPVIVTLPGKIVSQVQIADLDKDGRPDIVVTDQGTSGIGILVNKSAGAISFPDAPINLALTDPISPGGITTSGLAVEDLNGDDLTEIVTSQYLISNSNIYIAENKSTPGNIAFTQLPKITLSGSVVDIKVGDLDGDRKAEIAATQLLSNSVSIMLNLSSGSAISFASPKSFPTVNRPWGLDFGDLDGDGKPDIAVASAFEKSLTVLNNQSTAGNLVFQRLDKPTSFINRRISVGDIDGDGKPDIGFTSVDDENTGIEPSKVSIFRNKTCLVPVITPAGPLTICSSFAPLRINANFSRGTTYEWKLNGVTQTSGVDPFFDVSVSGDYTVTAIGEGGTCSETSNTVTINVAAGSTGAAVASNNGPVCAGNTLNLSVTNVGATSYVWTGPEGYSGSGVTPTPITNFKPENAGRYFVEIFAGGCLAQKVSTVVEIIDIPDFQVSLSGGNVICQGDIKTLSVTPAPAGFAWQWFKDGTLIGGATNPTFDASVAGSYTVKATFTLSAGCAVTETDPVSLSVVTLPVAGFTAPLTACAGEVVDFVNTSTTDNAASATYAWTFGDGNTSTEQSPSHQYLTANTFSVKLVVSYNGSCADEITKSITTTPSPTVTISSPNDDPDGSFTFCEGSGITLEVAGTFDTYTWSTGATTPTLDVITGGLYHVDVKTPSGCVIRATQNVTVTPAPTVIVTADPLQINEGETSQLTAVGLITFTWSPDETLTNPGSLTPIATPLVTTTYTITGVGTNGCEGQGFVQITVKGEPIVGKLTPGQFFSPNGDGMNPVWVVEKIDEFPQCGVTVYDDKGIKVYEAKPYLNDWDGTFKGRKLPDGVYYFVIRCDGEENKPRTGSITVLR